jgi:hypothetical protein
VKQLSQTARRHALRVAVLAVLVPGAVLGCADDAVRSAGAQTEEPMDTGLVPVPEPSFAPEDTATRTVAEAVEMRLEFVEDSIAEAEAALLAAERAAAAAGDSLPPPVPQPAPSYRAGEDPDLARRMGWPVDGPLALPGAILPDRRVVCYYGNPNSRRMGILGEIPKDQMLARLTEEVRAWNQADPEHPVMPCLHMVAVVAQADSGTTGRYRSIMRDATVSEVHSWAREVDGIFIVDIQVGTDDLRNILPRFEWILKEPDVHLAVDPEFYMRNGVPPGRRIGSMDAADINYATDYLAQLVREHDIPPKLLVLHRFTRNMVTNSSDIKLRPEVQIVMDMDGWGAAWLKRDSYRDYIVREPVQYTGFKIFYNNDTKGGDPIMMPIDLLRLHPVPLYVQYQ